MKCRKCTEKAILYMAQHRLALCRDHYREWFVNQTEKTIHRFKMFRKDEPVLVAISGGKDSLTLWDVLLTLGYEVTGLYIDLGINLSTLPYSKSSLDMIEKFRSSRGYPPLHVERVQDSLGATIPEITEILRRYRDKPCSVCGLIKRHEMNRIASKYGFPVVATGHNLDDEAAVLFQNVLQWQTEYLQRQYPVLTEEDGLVRKVKPLCRFYERETAAYALIRGIEYIYDECPFSTGASSIFYKEILNSLEEKRPGTKFQFYLSFVRARKEGRLFPLTRRPELKKCKICGQPTSSTDYCSFCRLKLQIQKEQPIIRS